MKLLFYFLIPTIIVLIVLPILISKNSLEYHDMPIKVFIASKSLVREMLLEEYVEGVVAAEMPASFELEALKAQAVAARTYAYGRITGVYSSDHNISPDVHICTDHKHCQAWIDSEQARKAWGIKYFDNWNKIKKAVNETRGEIIMYQGKIANPLFHANSGGATENPEDVWDGVCVDYLKSVESKGEETKESYRSSVILNKNEFLNKIKKQYPYFKIQNKNIIDDIKIISLSSGNRVKMLKIGNLNMKGTDFRNMFSLKSANFKIEKESDTDLKITVLGSGHGVGMSQCGSDYLASIGKDYTEILKYYYRNIHLSKIKK